MIKIDFPTHDFRIHNKDGKEQIWDECRKKWIILTPEEWVRQNFIQYLLQVMKYPASLIAVEKELHLGELKKRFDILVYNTSHQPWLMIECKAMNIPLTENTLQQIVHYNLALPVTYMVITNGSNTFAYCKEPLNAGWAEALPGIE